MRLSAAIIRLVSLAVTFFGVAVVVFVLVRVAPGDPIAMMVGPGASPQDIADLRALYGLDKSIPIQFAIWLGHVLRGDFGTSISLRQSVTEVVLGRLPATLELAFLALAIATVLGGGMAILAARWRGTATEAGVDLFNGVALAVPDFLWGLIFILLFGVAIPIFDISGRVSPSLELPFVTPFFLIESVVRLRFDLVGDLLGHMLMPAMALALPLAAVISHILKTSLKEVMHQDYVLVARTKGFSETYVLLHEALRNAVTPSLAVIGVQFTFLLGGTVIVERLFSYEGLGNLAIDAVINRDLPLIQGIVLLFAVIFVGVNLTVDLCAVALNPRLRHG
ncbi:MAG: ABC transporter permease [Roseiarcus sp.]|jgi:peptide/nickel transport system permease protein